MLPFTKPLTVFASVASILLMSWILSPASGQVEPEQPADEQVEGSGILPADGPTEQDFPQLHNLLQITPKLLTGGEPKTEAAFAELKSLGVKTVVSVDGARPDVETAKKYGLKYVHIPIGYDGIDETASNQLAKVGRDLVGPVYVHCHHGKHRGPAAAAVVCIASGDTTSENALKILEAAKTSKDYSGLWRDVGNYVPPPKDAELPELKSVVEVNSLAAAMANVDRAHDNLKLLSENDWQPPKNHPDLVAISEAVLMKENFRESVRQLKTKNDRGALFLTWMEAAETEAKSLEDLLRAKKTEAAMEKFKAIQEQCARCHIEYRN